MPVSGLGLVRRDFFGDLNYFLFLTYLSGFFLIILYLLVNKLKNEEKRYKTNRIRIETIHR